MYAIFVVQGHLTLRQWYHLPYTLILVEKAKAFSKLLIATVQEVRLALQGHCSYHFQSYHTNKFLQQHIISKQAR